jgi:hypothetical protein
VSPHVRTVRTSSGARAVQIVYSRRRGSRQIEHIGSAHDEVELELLKTVARQRLVAGQGELDLGLGAPAEAGGPLPITSARMGHLWDALCAAYVALGFDQATEDDDVFRQLVLARIIEPTSKLDSLRVPKRSGSPRPRMRRSSEACPCSPNRRGGRRWPQRVPSTRDWARPAWCCMTCRCAMRRLLFEWR